MREAEEKLAARLGFDIDYKAVREREEEVLNKLGVPRNASYVNLDE